MRSGVLLWVAGLSCACRGVVAPSVDNQAAVLVGAGDIGFCGGTGSEETAQLLDVIPGTVFTAGDNAYPTGSAADFAACYQPTWGRHLTRTRPSPGNHDYASPGAIPYFAYFGGRAGLPSAGYYSFALGAWHVVALNSNVSMAAGSPQDQWLHGDLATAPAACTLAYWHHPRFSSGDHGNDPRSVDAWRTLFDAGADLVINGHDHVYERFAPQTPDGVPDPGGIRQFTVGTGGAPLYGFPMVRPNSEVRNNGSFGVLKLILGSRSYRWEFIGPGMTVADSGTGRCRA